MLLQRLSLVPAVGHLMVKAGRVLKVTVEHEVATSGRPRDPSHVETRPLNGAANPLPLGEYAPARPGDLALELVDAGGRTRSFAYLAGAAAGLHREPSDLDGEIAWFEPARVERLTKLQRFCEEIGTADASPDRIAELEEFAIAELQRARHAELDLALLDIEAGDSYKKAAAAVRIWWNSVPTPAPRPDEDRTCHLVARLIRNRKLLRARFRKSSGAAYLHSQPTKHAGWPPASVFSMEALLEATLPS